MCSKFSKQRPSGSSAALARQTGRPFYASLAHEGGAFWKGMALKGGCRKARVFAKGLCANTRLARSWPWELIPKSSCETSGHREISARSAECSCRTVGRVTLYSRSARQQGLAESNPSKIFSRSALSLEPVDSQGNFQSRLSSLRPNDC